MRETPRLALLPLVVLVMLALAPACASDSRRSGDDRNQTTDASPARAAPRSVCEALVERVRVPEMIREADAVFIGTVSSVGPNESFRGFDGYRVRFDVSQVLRGRPAKRIEVVQIACNEIDLAEIGVTHLIFAERRPLGEERYRALTPFGYQQGVFRLRGGSAVNPINGTVSLAGVTRAVGDS